jgi:TolB-like protein
MEFLSQAERDRLESLRATDGFVTAALDQVQRILAGRKFARVQQRAKDFLVFVVAKTLVGTAHHIKESTIAISVYGESDFDPLENSKIRVAAGDLRQRLNDYIAEEGADDPIEIRMPLATYVPTIRDCRAFVAVSQLDNWHPRHDQDYLCKSVSDELVYRLNQVRWVRARAAGSLADPSGAMTFGLRGSLEIQGDRIRLHLSLADLTSDEIVSGRTFEGHRDDHCRLTGDIAATLCTALRTAMAHGAAAVPVRSIRRRS